MFKRSFSSITAVICLAFLLSAGVLGQKGENGISRISNDGGSVSWRMLVPHKSVTLTVSIPDGTVFRREFRSGSAPVFSLADKSGEHYGDGTFTYELVITPEIPAEIKEQMMAARENGNSEDVETDLKKRGLLPEFAVESGSFRVISGQLFTKTDAGEEMNSAKKSAGDRTESADVPTSNVVLTNGNGVIRPSLCVGNDCPNNPNFGFDTIRMQENNTRLQFEDTSSVGSFPTNNWQIRANSSSNGGTNFLGFVDQGANGNSESGTVVFLVEAGAPSNALRIDSQGDAGFGTSSPVVDLHVVDGNTPTLRLEQNGSAGFTPQTWDVAGNETNFFVRDVTMGSSLPLRIRTGAPTSSIDIAGTGRIGIGTSSPAASVHVRRTDGTAQFFVEEASGTTSNTRIQLQLENNGSAQAALVDSNTGVDWRFQNLNSNFRITKAGTGVAEMSMDGSGNVIFQGTVSANNGGATLPDYVFEPDYRLMPLGELEAFIREHKHLPNIPSNGDVKAANGVLNMTEMQYKLLEKVEELTLYTIEQKKALDAREQETRQLKAEVEALKSLVKSLIDK